MTDIDLWSAWWLWMTVAGLVVVIAAAPGDHFMATSFTRTFTIATAITLTFSSCQAWKVDTRPVDAVIRQNPNQKVALTMADRRWIVLRDIRLENDSVFGHRVTGNTKGVRRTALPLGGVRAVETRRFSFLRTVGLGIALAFVPSLYRLAVVEED